MVEETSGISQWLRRSRRDWSSTCSEDFSSIRTDTWITHKHLTYYSSQPSCFYHHSVQRSPAAGARGSAEMWSLYRPYLHSENNTSWTEDQQDEKTWANAENPSLSDPKHHTLTHSPDCRNHRTSLEFLPPRALWWAAETQTQTSIRSTAQRSHAHSAALYRSTHGHCSRCVFTAVSVHLDGLNAEDKFRVWVTILGHTPLPFPFPFLGEQSEFHTDQWRDCPPHRLNGGSYRENIWIKPKSDDSDKYFTFTSSTGTSFMYFGACVRIKNKNPSRSLKRQTFSFMKFNVIRRLYTAVQRFLMFNRVSSAHQGCIYLIKKYTKKQ